MSGRAGRWTALRRWLPDAGAIAAVAVLVVVKCWSLVRPWDREYRAADFALTPSSRTSTTG
jgi:hypothetical protein